MGQLLEGWMDRSMKCIRTVLGYLKILGKERKGRSSRVFGGVNGLRNTIARENGMVP